MKIRLRIPVIITAVYAVGAGLMFGWFIPAVVAACHTQPLDALFTWNRATADALLAACGADGIAAYERVATMDLIYPALLALCIGSWILWFASRIGMPRWGVLLALVPSAVNMVFDYLENMAVWTLLRSGANDPSALLDIGGTFTAVKSVSGILGFVTVTVLLVVYVVVAIRRRRVA